MSKDFSFKNSNYSSADGMKFPNEDARFERLESRHNSLQADFANLVGTVENVPTQISTLTSGKADITYVNQTIAAVNGGPKGTFATLTALQADATANTTDGKKNVYLVAADGKWYYWNGSAWTAGNTYQATGIADNSITVEKIDFVSATGYKQLLDISNPKVNQYYKNTSPGATGGATGNIAVEFVPEVGATYVLFGIWSAQTFAYNGTTQKVITSLSGTTYYSNSAASGLAQDVPYVITIPAGTTKLYITGYVSGTQILKPMIFKTSDQIHPATYVEFNAYFDKKLVIENLHEPQATQALTEISTIKANVNAHKSIHVKTDGSGNFISLVEAINSITDSSATNIYDVYVYQDHDIISELGGQTWWSSIVDETITQLGLRIPEYVNIIGAGTGKPKLKGEILASWGYNYYATKLTSTINLIGANNNFENLIITAKNMRYAVHDDKSLSGLNSFRNWKNCEAYHYGNAELWANHAYAWRFPAAYGMGTASGFVGSFENCKFVSNSFTGFGAHDNHDFGRGSILKFNTCEFKNLGENEDCLEDASLSSYGAGTHVNTAIFNNCIINTLRIKLETVDDTINRWRVTGTGNKPSAIAENGITPTTITFT